MGSRLKDETTHTHTYIIYVYRYITVYIYIIQTVQPKIPLKGFSCFECVCARVGVCFLTWPIWFIPAFRSPLSSRFFQYQEDFADEPGRAYQEGRRCWPGALAQSQPHDRPLWKVFRKEMIKWSWHHDIHACLQKICCFRRFVWIVLHPVLSGSKRPVTSRTVSPDITSRSLIFWYPMVIFFAGNARLQNLSPIPLAKLLDCGSTFGRKSPGFNGFLKIKDGFT